ncbi:MAG: hypothetical protein JO181_15510 [Solirubrobacterales bacterium]|nr:hypothetical protein [Solirubrobacterales bacterium]
MGREGPDLRWLAAEPPSERQLASGTAGAELALHQRQLARGKAVVGRNMMVRGALAGVAQTQPA